jgi:hypothetical protein
VGLLVYKEYCKRAIKKSEAGGNLDEKPVFEHVKNQDSRQRDPPRAACGMRITRSTGCSSRRAMIFPMILADSSWRAMPGPSSARIGGWVHTEKY